jgi:PhnB protein
MGTHIVPSRENPRHMQTKDIVAPNKAQMTDQPGGTPAKNELIHPYLFFGGRCEEAMNFYAKALGGEVVDIMLNKDNPEPPPPGTLPKGFEGKVLNATLRIGGTTLMASDGMEEGAKFGGFSLSMAVPTEAEADRAFAALSEGGQVKVPLAKTFFSPRFGMLTDRFGLGWMVSVVA